MLYLENKYRLREKLLNMQALCKLEGGDFVIDQCSVKRNEILVRISVLGGEGERSLPLDTLTQVRVKITQGVDSLFCPSYSVLDVYRVENLFMAWLGYLKPEILPLTF